MQELIIVGGANGSGKTTFSKQFLAETNYFFLNADEIEKELSTSKLQAGKVFFNRIDDLADNAQSFVLESTLSGKYLLKVIERLKKKKYIIKLVYIFLLTPEDCVQRISLRVQLGGHFIPDEDVYRRFYRSKSNFWKVYKNMADEWLIFYNSATEFPQRVVVGQNENYFIESEELFEYFIKDIAS